MKVELTNNDSSLKVYRDGDKKIYKETEFWHKLKKHLNYHWKSDLIKKIMIKDGHMVSDHVYYLRDRKWKYCIWDGNHQLRLVYENFNKEDFVLLHVEWWERKGY